MVEKPVVPAGSGSQTIPGALIVAYRFVWLILFAMAVASLTYFNPRDEDRSIRRTTLAHAVGFVPYAASAADGLMGSAYGAEGRRLGFRESDVLLTVDGHRMASASPIR